ncbi:hypothetical protein RYX36_006708 [Vicia faba]
MMKRKLRLSSIFLIRVMMILMMGIEWVVLNVGSVDSSGVNAKANKKVVPSSSKKVAENLGKLDLNVECSNKAEEPSREVRNREANATGNAENNIEGIGFFEGLDEFLSSLPILNAVADDKVKGH